MVVEEIGKKEMEEVPSYFKCPISLCLMTDPVSICTGITYDRSSIQKWFDEGRRICPVTMQPLDSHDIIPNRTLHRIIHSWRSAHQKISPQSPPPPPHKDPHPMDFQQARVLIREIQDPISRPEALKTLGKDLERNRRLFIKAGLVSVLVSLFSAACDSPSEEDDFQPQLIVLLAQLRTIDEEQPRKSLISNLPAIAWLLQRGDLHTRISAAVVLEELSCQERDSRGVIGSTPGIFEGLARLIQEESQSPRHRPAIRASLRAVLAICPPMKNRVRLVESGAIAPLVELLIDSDKGTTEAVLAVLECVCGCAEGRAEVSRNALAIPVVTKKLFKGSDMATEYAMDVLWAVCKYCPDEGVRRRMVEVGLFPKLFFFLQIGCNPRTKSKAGDLLKLLHRAYRECLQENDNNNTCLLTA